MVKFHKLSPIYDANNLLKIGNTKNDLVPQKEIKNLLNQIQFDENILHKYQNWTYHLQWYMIPYNTMIAREYMMLHSIDEVEQAAVDGFDDQRIYGFTNRDFYQIDPSEKVVIFETGVTAQYTFEGLNFKTVYSENDLNGFIHMTNMTLKFKEINGCTFKDKWQCVSRALGYTNNINVPYFLEISFIGYDPNTGMPVVINDRPYLFKTVITGVDAQINPSGTSYTIKMCPFTQYGFSKDNFVAENLGKIANEINGGTFKDLITSLEDTLNKKFFEIADNAELEKYYPKSDGSSGKRYVFVIDDAIKDIGITPNPSYYTQTGETRERTPNPNKTIDSIIRDMWYYITPGSLENVDLRVFTKQVIVGKRPADAGLIEQIYYFIVPYYVPFKEYYVTKFKAQKEGKKPTLPIRNLAEHINFLQQNGLLSRRYDYMYNGRDINVLNFDFKIDGLWYLKPPTELGKMIDYNKFDQPSDELSPALMPKAIEDFIGQTVDILGLNNSFFSALYKKWNKNNTENTTKYLDDINDLISETDRIVYLNYGKVPVRADNTSPIDEDNQASETEYTPIIRKSAMEELHSSGKMCKINFEIIGDPFWLGDETYDNSLCRIKKCVYGNHEIVFNVKTPAQQDKITGDINIDTSTTVSGFYQVIGVEHNFTSGGKFTQKITAVIDSMSVVRSDYEDSGLSISTGVSDTTSVQTSDYTPRKEEIVKEIPTQVMNYVKEKTNINEMLCKLNYNQTATKLADIGQSTIAGKATQFKSWV